MRTSDFNYTLPPELIAQHPPAVRGTSRMMVLHRTTGFIEHRHITDLPAYMRSGDVMVVNDTKVFPARILGAWEDTAGALELLLLNPLPVPPKRMADAPEVTCWSCIHGGGRPVRPGQRALFAEGALTAEILETTGQGVATVLFASTEPLMNVLDRFGHTPVPPYIHRTGSREEELEDRKRYQTIYAKETGAVAAPTAGLHFTPEIFAALDAKGVIRTEVTLHVGPGTFKPVKVAEIEDHHMDSERYTVPQATADAIAHCHATGGRVLAVGSTSVRTLETVAAEHDGNVVACHGASTIFIHPPYTFRVPDMMLTNFHLPQSTLIMMIAAMVGRERILAAYHEAIRKGYRFFSYGDCMLIME